MASVAAMALRRYSELRGRKLRVDEALLERVVMSPVGYRYLLHVAPRIDKVVIPRTRGRLSSTGVDKVGLVTTVGAKSGERRTHPLALIPAGATGETGATGATAAGDDSLLAIGSNYGRATHPAWSHNLLAHPDCEVEFRGAPQPYRAELLAGADREPAWATAVDFYAGYERYRQRCAPREIRVFRLRPV